MKHLIVSVAIAVALFTTAGPAFAKTIKVNSYYKPSTSTYVSPHYKTSPNSTKLDNYSTKGNYNPYTGKVGTKKIY